MTNEDQVAAAAERARDRDTDRYFAVPEETEEERDEALQAKAAELEQLGWQECVQLAYPGLSDEAWRALGAVMDALEEIECGLSIKLSIERLTKLMAERAAKEALK